MRFAGRLRRDLREVTLEADPETITAEKAAAWVAAGIRRDQFWRAVVLRCRSCRRRGGCIGERMFIGRCRCCARRGSSNISFDLIAGLPGQTRGELAGIAGATCGAAAGACVDLFAGGG